LYTPPPPLLLLLLLLDVAAGAEVATGSGTSKKVNAASAGGQRAMGPARG
jgi:hypothetical protein